jgi:hypothetical protein
MLLGLLLLGLLLGFLLLGLLLLGHLRKNDFDVLTGPLAKGLIQWSYHSRVLISHMQVLVDRMQILYEVINHLSHKLFFPWYRRSLKGVGITIVCWRVLFISRSNIH